ncbi:MAG TPA: UbiA family prenyltransferase [Gemmataceae bacterium]|nr:UbiA family prenyltransferase [Gemmataceae bacterium]
MSDLRAYAQLTRLPNLPTALADICLGALAAGALPQHALAFAALLPASACLYSAGMVWNDYFDQEQDRRERPFRPLPSGRVAPREAVWLGISLFAAGTLLALLAGRTSLLIALCLMGAILAYDGWLKRTWAGPLAMGTCRFLNVLLGVSACGSLLGPRGAHLALIVGLYIVGVTWFARTEARLSNQNALRGAAAVMLVSLLLALPLPVFLPEGQHSSFLFPYLLVALGFWVGGPVVRAIANPAPSQVQAAVKRALMALILLDTVLATATAGAVGLVILLLLAPSLYLNRKRWLYAT